MNNKEAKNMSQQEELVPRWYGDDGSDVGKLHPRTG